MPREAEPRLNKGKDNRRTQTFKIQELLSRGGQPDPAEPSLSILRTRRQIGRQTDRNLPPAQPPSGPRGEAALSASRLAP